MKIVQFSKLEAVELEKEFILGEGCFADIPEGLELALLKFHLKERSLIYLKNKYAVDVKSVCEESPISDPELKYEVSLLEFKKVLKKCNILMTLC